MMNGSRRTHSIQRRACHAAETGPKLMSRRFIHAVRWLHAFLGGGWNVVNASENKQVATEYRMTK
jgi:hypothetical protein